MSGSLENCRRKVRCETSFDAITAAWRMQFKNPFAKINAYSCKYCDGWHIGNAYNRKDAKKSLNRLARMMLHPNFFSKVPQEVQLQLLAKRSRMEGFLAHRAGANGEAVKDEVMRPAVYGLMPRWRRRRVVQPVPDTAPPIEFRVESILPS